MTNQKFEKNVFSASIRDTEGEVFPLVRFPRFPAKDSTIQPDSQKNTRKTKPDQTPFLAAKFCPETHWIAKGSSWRCLKIDCLQIRGLAFDTCNTYVMEQFCSKA